MLHLTPRDNNLSKILFFHFFHLYLPDGAVGALFLKYAKFGHKITLKSPLFDFQEVSVTSWKSKGGDLRVILWPNLADLRDDFFFSFFHLYLLNGGDRFFFLNSAKFGHKMTPKSPHFDFQEVTETSWKSKRGDFRVILWPNLSELREKNSITAIRKIKMKKLRKKIIS